MLLNVSERLTALRIDAHLSQEQVAQLTGVSRQAISSYENDQRQPPYNILVKLAHLYRSSTDYILGCTNIRNLNLSGLTPEEESIISQLVLSMSDKNEQMKILKRR